MTTAPTLLRNGSIYSPSDPFASAILIEGSEILWIGSEQAADSLEDQHKNVIDLRGDLITPGFVNSADSLQTCNTPDSLENDPLTHGFIATVNTGPIETTKNFDENLKKSHIAIYQWPSITLDELETKENSILYTGIHHAMGLRLTLTPGVNSKNHIINFIKICLDAHKKPGIIIDSIKNLEMVSEALNDFATLTGKRTLNSSEMRIEFLPSLPVHEVQKFLEKNKYYFTICLDPQKTQIAATSHRQGFLTTLGSTSFSRAPWSGIQALLNHPIPQERVSTRAAFTAATRSAWRALNPTDSWAGQLVPGAEATYVRWRVDALMVQAPEGTAAAWSTDPRARTPLLPALEDGTSQPVCISTTIRGQTMHQR